MNENLKKKWNKVEDVFYKIAIIEIALSIVWLLNFSCGYFIEKMYMTCKLKKIPNVKVVDIWGNEDLDLEEIAYALGISQNTMKQKIENIETFTLEEINILFSILHVSNPINFFAQMVDKVSTNQIT